MKYSFFSLFLCWVTFSIAQNNKPSYLDSLEQIVSKMPIKKKLQLINEIPYVKFVAEVDKSQKLFKKAESIAIKLKDSLILGDLIFKQGQLKSYQNKFDESLELTLKAITIFEKTKNYKQAGVAYGGLGYALKRTNLEKSLYYMRKGIKLLEKDNDLECLNPIYDNYGVVLNMKTKNDSALYYQKKSLKIKKQLNDSVFKSSNVIASLFMAQIVSRKSVIVE
uniref:hypothetical protein n=1 Tax=Flavobacterium sp. TaxID=239 RepID=UPI004047C042